LWRFSAYWAPEHSFGLGPVCPLEHAIHLISVIQKPACTSLCSSAFSLKKVKVIISKSTQSDVALSLLCSLTVLGLHAYCMPQVYCPCSTWLTSPAAGPPHPAQTFCMEEIVRFFLLACNLATYYIPSVPQILSVNCISV